MLRWSTTLALGAVGCFNPPDLPLIDEIPVVGFAANVCAAPKEVDIGCVLDGDTFDFGGCGEGNGERVRMLGVDAPEIAHNDSEVADCYGDESHAELARILMGRRVLLTFDEECLDIYDRTLAYVWLVGDEAEDLLAERDVADLLADGDADGDALALLINEYMIAYGFAGLYGDDADEYSADIIYESRLKAAESRAAVFERGLWSACDGVASAPPSSTAAMLALPNELARVETQ
jgi:micrococcal nuclease